MAGRRPATPVRPNILLITLDTTRADHLGAYGDRAARTPRLDRLASEGVLFERAVAAAPITLPAHASLLTGRYPFAHGVRNNGNFAVGENMPTLATALRDRGYRTAAFVSAFVLDRRSGLARGFEQYDDRLDSAGGRTADIDVERRGDRTARAAEQWLAEHLARTDKSAPATNASRAASSDSASRTDRPLFAWVHLYDPHDPYNPPPPFDEAFRAHPYDGEIAFDDSVVGSLVDQLDRLGVLSSTIVAIAGDHGESLGEHGEATHAMFVYESALRIPLIVWWPGHLAAGTRVAALVRGIDLTPTLLDLAGLPPLADVDGRSLVPLVHGRAAGPGSAYGETYFPLFFMNWAPLRSIQDERWKYIDAPAPELYDLVNDPREQSNLAAREPARASALRRALDGLSNGTGAMARARPDREATEKLAALGYVSMAATADENAEMAGRADPKTMIDVFNRLRQANSAVREGRPAEAEAIAREILARDRRNGFAALIVARAQLVQGRCREAIASYRAYAALVPTSADARHSIAICHARLGEAARAIEEESAAIAIDPQYVAARLLRAGLLTERGRLDEAEADYRRAIELQPSSANAHSGYGVLLDARGEPARAVPELEQALELKPDLHEVRLALGGILERLGRKPEARVEYQRLASSGAVPKDIRNAATKRLAR